MQDKHGLKVLIPNTKDRKFVHDIIYQELCLGVTKDQSKVEYCRIIEALKNEGAQAVILGCTEIGMLIKQNNTDVKLFDTTQIHANKAVEFALSENSSD